MSVFSPDSSCIVATVVSTHVHHARAVAALDRHLDDGDRMVIVAHTLPEAFSTLTRSPAPLRRTPEEAARLIEANFLRHGAVVALEPAQYVTLLANLASQGIAGGQVYDPAIAACARLGGADVLLTFNSRHFERFAGDGLSIETP